MSLATARGTAPKKIRCLVIQLSPLGDTLQSLMALRAAKQLYPDLEIHFLAQQRFSFAAQRVPWITQVITLPAEQLVSPVKSGQNTEKEAICNIAHWITPLIDKPWDFVINWSYSQSSSFLTALIPSRIKLGYSRSNDTSFSSLDGWSDYIQAIIQGGRKQNIHLTDILTTQILTALQIHIGDPSDNGNSPVTSKDFFAIDPKKAEVLYRKSTPGDLSLKKWLGIQLGSISNKTTWPIENWAMLAALILKNHPEIALVLLGEEQELERTQTFYTTLQRELGQKSDLKNRVITVVGQTDFDQWASIVSRCHWIFAEDSAVIHLASVLGVRVMNLLVGAHPWLETGPYGNGHYIIENESISPEIAYATWSYAMSEWSHQRRTSLQQHFKELELDPLTQQLRIYRSKIRGAQDGGGVSYEPLLQTNLLLEDWGAMVMGHIARSWYCGWVPPIGQELLRSMVNPALLKELRELNESSEVLLKVCEEAKKTALGFKFKSGLLRSEKIMKLGDREELKSLGKKITELDQLIERLGKTHCTLLPFTRMSKIMMHNLKGSQLSELGNESAESYQLLVEGVAILREWIQYTLNLAKPTVVHDSQAVRTTEAHPS